MYLHHDFSLALCFLWPLPLLRHAWVEHLRWTHHAAMKVSTILSDPPWRFANRTGKAAPEYSKHPRYKTMSVDDIAGYLRSQNIQIASQAHCYLWVPNALLYDGLYVLQEWGFEYKTMLVWHKIVMPEHRSDRRGVGYYFRNVTEVVLFGVRGKLRTLSPYGRSQVNIIEAPTRGHSRKPDELYEIIERCSPEPWLELFARYRRPGWTQLGDELELDMDKIAAGLGAERRGGPGVPCGGQLTLFDPSPSSNSESA